MDLTEQTIDSTLKYSGVVVKVKVDRVRVPGGKTSVREVVEHPGGVAILPLDEAGNIVMVTQYRYVLGRELLEVPAGKMEAGEEPGESALRELREETGLIPGELIPLGAVIASPGFCDEKLYLFLARGLEETQTDPDEDEFLIIERIPFQQVVDRIMSDEIQDAKTVAAVLKAKQYLNR